MLHADERPGRRAGARWSATVEPHRRPGRRPHPLNRLARRALAARRGWSAEPGLVGAAELEPVAGPRPAAGVKDSAPAVAASASTTPGEPVVVVGSVGIDLDLVPAAADLRLAHDPEARWSWSCPSATPIR